MDSASYIIPNGEAEYVKKVCAEKPVEKDEEIYPMKKQNRGQAFIFSNIDSEMAVMAETAEIDAINFKTMCTAFGFSEDKIKYYKIKKQKEIDNIFNDFVQKDHTEEDCVLVVFITNEKGLAAIRHYLSPYHYEGYILPQLFPDKCPSLAAKPKLIFFQVYCEITQHSKGACKFEKEDSDDNSSYKIPMPADFLIVFNTSEAIPAPRSGSVFYRYLSHFCKNFKEKKPDPEDCDLITLLTGTMNAISQEAPLETVPMWTSTLIREVRFFPSEKSE